MITAIVIWVIGVMFSWGMMSSDGGDWSPTMWVFALLGWPFLLGFIAGSAINELFKDK